MFWVYLYNQPKPLSSQSHAVALTRAFSLEPPSSLLPPPSSLLPPPSSLLAPRSSLLPPPSSLFPISSSLLLTSVAPPFPLHGWLLTEQLCPFLSFGDIHALSMAFAHDPRSVAVKLNPSLSEVLLASRGQAVAAFFNVAVMEDVRAMRPVVVSFQQSLTKIFEWLHLEDMGCNDGRSPAEGSGVPKRQFEGKTRDDVEGGQGGQGGHGGQARDGSVLLELYQGLYHHGTVHSDGHGATLVASRSKLPQGSERCGPKITIHHSSSPSPALLDP